MLCEEPARVEFLPPNPAHDDAAPFSPKDDLARILALSGTDQCLLYLSRFSTYTPPSATTPSVDSPPLEGHEDLRDIDGGGDDAYTFLDEDAP